MIKKLLIIIVIICLIPYTGLCLGYTGLTCGYTGLLVDYTGLTLGYTGFDYILSLEYNLIIFGICTVYLFLPPTLLFG